METYTKLDGSVVSLRDLPETHAAYLMECVELFRGGADSRKLHERVYGARNPVLERRPGLVLQGYVTREAYASPLFQVLRDLLFRAEVREGLVAADPDDFLSDPLSDEWIPSSQAATELGISLVAVHKAIEAGKLVSKPAKEGGRNIVISRNSILAYQKNTRRPEFTGTTDNPFLR